MRCIAEAMSVCPLLLMMLPYSVNSGRLDSCLRPSPFPHPFIFLLVLPSLCPFSLPSSLFGGVLKWKGEAEKALRESGMAYTVSPAAAAAATGAAAAAAAATAAAAVAAWDR